MMRMIAAFKKVRFSLLYLIGFFLVLLCNFSFAISDFDRGNALQKVLTTRFDDSGNLSWKLRADEITPKGNSLYLVENPVLQTIHANGNITEANTSRGFFDLDEGKAEGPALMVVRGNGFGMSGIDWVWQQKSGRDGHRMLFRKDGELFLQSIKSKSLASFNLDKENGFPKSNTKTQEKTVSTSAEADFIELLSMESGGYRFSLKGNVSIVGEGVSIACSNTQIFFLFDANSSSAVKIGRIREIQAEGAVTLKQTGRICQADRLNLDPIRGVVLLEGSARVEDDAWGSAVGEKILLEKETGKVQILKSGNSRPRLTFPSLDLDKLKFPFAPKKKPDSK